MSGDRTLRDVGRRNLLANRAYGEIRESIFDNRLAPGAASLSELRELVEEHRRVPDKGEGLSAHMKFHRRIRELADGPALSELLGNLQGEVRLATHSLRGGADAPRRALEYHEKILTAISAGDAAVAEKAARAHIARVREALTDTAGREKGTA